MNKKLYKVRKHGSAIYNSIPSHNQQKITKKSASADFGDSTVVAIEPSLPSAKSIVEIKDYINQGYIKRKKPSFCDGFLIGCTLVRRSRTCEVNI